MAFSPDAVTVAWLMAPGTIEPAQPDQRWRCAGCHGSIRPEETWLAKYRIEGQAGGPRHDLICVDCATRLAGVVTRTADDTT